MNVEQCNELFLLGTGTGFLLGVMTTLTLVWLRNRPRR